MPDASNLVKKSDYNTKITGIENNIKKLQAYDLSYYRGKQYFDEGGGKQNYLVFLPMSKYFKLSSVARVSDYVLSWQSDKGTCNKGFIWKPSYCECECDKSCNIGEYLDYSSCKCRKKLIDPLVEECTENINEASLVKKNFR